MKKYSLILFSSLSLTFFSQNNYQCGFNQAYERLFEQVPGSKEIFLKSITGEEQV